MGLTPEDIRDKKFSTVRGFREGYNLVEVDAFLDAVQAEVARLRSEISTLKDSANAGEHNAAAARMLELAQRTAEEHIAAAQGQAERLISEAREKITSLQEQAEAQRAALERRTEDLRAFEREYRAKLQAFIEAALGELSGRGQS